MPYRPITLSPCRLLEPVHPDDDHFVPVWSVCAVGTAQERSKADASAMAVGHLKPLLRGLEAGHFPCQPLWPSLPFASSPPIEPWLTPESPPHLHRRV